MAYRISVGQPQFRLTPETGDELTAQQELIVQAIDAGTYFVENEVPTGAVDGANAIYTTANTVSPVTSAEVWLNGVKQKAGGVDYTFSSTNTITFVTAPLSGSLLLVNYRRTP